MNLRRNDIPAGLRRVATIAFGAIPALVALALLLVFWHPLVRGGGFIGGDTYNYFFPLKDLLADGLRTGTIYLWHPRIGNGVPVLGESQTGALYPPNLLAYSTLDLNSAYNAIFLSHYILAFLFTFGLARTLRIRVAGSLLAATVFVYGWFPPRDCLEWAIVSGAWMPAVILAALRFVETGRVRWALATSFALAIQLLVGHFNLAWITLFALAVLVVVWRPRDIGFIVACRRKTMLTAAILGAFGLAAMQLIPAWELKSRSQRAEVAFQQQIEEGRVPIAYLPQALAPWRYYFHPDETLAAIGAKTNKVEAHLYFGLVPLALALLGLASTRTLRDGWPWLLLGLVGLSLATGLVMPWLARLPGFAFFRYCGRYGLATQLAVAVLAGMAADRLPFRSNLVRSSVAVILLAVTAFDLYLVGRQVQYVEITSSPIINLRNQSPIFRLLRSTDRVLAVDGNTLALSPAACVPPYLGMGPADYYKTWDAMPDVFHGKTEYTDSIGQVLRPAGVTHVLTFDPLPPGWPVTRLFRGYDPFLHARWDRDPREPIYLYHFDQSRGRAFAETQSGDPMRDAKVVVDEVRPQRIVLDVAMPKSGRVVLTDLDFPGWSVTIDGNPARTSSSRFSRIVDVAAGDHRIVWVYRPMSVAVGVSASAGTLVLLILFAFRYRSNW